MSAYPATMTLPDLTPKVRKWVLFEPKKPKTVIKSACMSATAGTGKTTASFARFILACWRSCQWNDSYGRSNPLALITSPTAANIQENIWPLFLRHVPSELILETRTSPSREIVLANGCRILFKSGLSLIDSMSVRVLWVDEADNVKAYGQDHKFEMILARCRDSKARGPREIIFSGIAQPDEKTVARFKAGVDNLCTPGLDDNPGIDQEYKDSILATLTAEQAKIAKVGGWRTRLTGDALGDVLDLRLGGNVTDEHGDEGGSCIVSIDSGRQSALLFVREIQVPELRHGKPSGNMVPGLCVIDENTFDDHDNKMIIEEAKGWPYQIHEVCLDATDGINAVALARQAWSGPISQLPRGSTSYLRKDKFSRLRWALCDAHGTRRLLLHKRLLDSNDKRGIVEALKTSEVNKHGTDFVKNNRTDHSREALAGVVQAKLMPQAERKSYRKATWRKGSRRG